MQLRHRYVELGVVGIVEFEELHVAFAEIHVDQSLIAGDAVLLMYYRIANLEFGQVTQPVVERSLALRRLLAAARGAAGEEFGLGDKRDTFGLVEDESFVQRRDAERQTAVAGKESTQVSAGVGFDALFGQQPG